MMMGGFYVVAGRYQHAKVFADSKNVPAIRIRYIDAPEKIKGLLGVKLYVLKSASELDDIHEIMQEAQIRGFSVEYA